MLETLTEYVISNQQLKTSVELIELLNIGLHSLVITTINLVRFTLVVNYCVYLATGEFNTCEGIYKRILNTVFSAFITITTR